MNINDEKPQVQTADNPAGEPLTEITSNSQQTQTAAAPLDDEAEKEQQFKEAQTERD